MSASDLDWLGDTTMNCRDFIRLAADIPFE
jgi:hypothetical protein